MFEKIVVGYDGSDQARDALALGRLIAGTTGGELIAASVWESLGHLPPIAFGRWQEFARDQAGRTAAEAGDGTRPEVVESTSAARGLHDLAEREHADLIVVGSSHLGRAGRALAGTVGVSLLHGSPCPVAVAPTGFRDSSDTEIRVVGVGYDGQPEADVALGGAIELAKAAGASLRIVTVARPPASGFEGKGYIQEGRAELAAAVKESMQEVLDRGLASVPPNVDASGALITDSQDPHGDDIDLMVLGSRGYGPARRVLVGSNSARLLTAAPCPAIVFPRGTKAPAPEEANGATSKAVR
jgi:nucleotide-binding universal stress UspA family protein